MVNAGEEDAEVRIEGIDDAGDGSGDAVVLGLGAGMSRTLTAQQLETGEGLSGGLGEGEGRWRLEVSADRPVEVLHLVASAAGVVSNVSTVAAPVVVATAAEVFAESVSVPIVQGKCVVCHVEGGVAGQTRLHFVRDTDPEHESRNLATFQAFLGEVDDGAEVVLSKIQGVGHGGGVQVGAGTVGFAEMERFLAGLGEDVVPVAMTPQTLFDTVRDGVGEEDVAPSGAGVCGSGADGGGVRGGAGWGGGAARDDSRADDGPGVSRVPDPGEQRPAPDRPG